MKNPNISRLIAHGIILSGLIFAGLPLIIPAVSEKYMIFICTGGGIAFAGIILGAIRIRCPFCHRGLTLFGIWTDYCPHCGEKL